MSPALLWRCIFEVFLLVAVLASLGFFRVEEASADVKAEALVVWAYLEETGLEDTKGGRCLPDANSDLLTGARFPSVEEFTDELLDDVRI